uniref:Uncharacterized protein n=1 Tax=Ditylenchus dipsaci TaxID=166011 RepID=A0A915EFV1_9BILA
MAFCRRQQDTVCGKVSCRRQCLAAKCLRQSVCGKVPCGKQRRIQTVILEEKSASKNYALFNWLYILAQALGIGAIALVGCWMGFYREVGLSSTARPPHTSSCPVVVNNNWARKQRKTDQQQKGHAKAGRPRLGHGCVIFQQASQWTSTSARRADRDSGNETSSLSPCHTPMTGSPTHSLPSRSNSFSVTNILRNEAVRAAASAQNGVKPQAMQPKLEPQDMKTGNSQFGWPAEGLPVPGAPTGVANPIHFYQQFAAVAAAAQQQHQQQQCFAAAMAAAARQELCVICGIRPVDTTTVK